MGSSWGWGGGRAGPPLPSVDRTLCQCFSPGLRLLGHHPFQQEFSLFWSKCNSKKIPLESSGTREQAANGQKHPLSMQPSSKMGPGFRLHPRSI